MPDYLVGQHFALQPTEWWTEWHKAGNVYQTPVSVDAVTAAEAVQAFAQHFHITGRFWAVEVVAHTAEILVVEPES